VTRALKRILASKREEVRDGWRKLHKAELNDLYLTLDAIRVIKSVRMGWSGHVACMVRCGIQTEL
jgi:hypothetical protein